MPHRFRNGAFAALVGLAASTVSAQAGEYFAQGDRGAANLPSMTRWGDTYAGAVSAVSFRHGTYFSIDRDTRPDFAPQEKRRPALIIDAREARCSYEAGVCVIRP